jgi:hypothetical protein
MSYKSSLADYESATEALKCFTEALNIIADVSLSQAEIDLITERMATLMGAERTARLNLIGSVMPRDTERGRV